METNLFNFPKPTGISPRGAKARNIVLGVMKKHHLASPDLGYDYTGGCIPFYSTKEWLERGEKYGQKSNVVICHDGGVLSHVFGQYDLDRGIRQEIDEALAKEGMFVEACTGWYSAVYDS